MFPHNTNIQGGTEYQASYVNAHFVKKMPKLQNYLLSILPGTIYQPGILLQNNNIVWLHNYLNQFGQFDTSFYVSNAFNESIKTWIVPSNTLKEHLVDLKVPTEKITVIPNAIEPLTYNAKKFENTDVLKIVFMPTGHRGLHHLLHALPHLKGNFEIDVFSEVHDLPNTAKEILMDKRINLYGKSKRDTVLKHIEQAHLFLYPASFNETFCISMVECMSAGLSVVTSSAGALPEIGKNYIRTFDWSDRFKQHIDLSDDFAVMRTANQLPSLYQKDLNNFIKQANIAIEEIQKGKFNPEKQIEYVNNTYSWKTAEQNWLNWHEVL